MPAFIEFLLIAFVLYLWESALWLPLRGVALRRAVFGGGWRVLDPGSLFSTRDAGLVPMRPLPPDAGLAPCQIPPLIATSGDSWFLEAAHGRVPVDATLSWDDFAAEPHHLRVAGIQLRISSPRLAAFLRDARSRGDSPREAVRRLWRASMSPRRALHEWKRWNLVARPLRLWGLLLTVGFFAGLPAVHLTRGGLATVALAAALWLVMACIAARLWWLGNRVYPDAKGAFTLDALLALLVPFHAMRASGIASVHALSMTHPAALLIGTNDLGNPWLAKCMRRILHPSPGIPGDAEVSGELLPVFTAALRFSGASPGDFDRIPDRSGDHQATRFCPRCHALFMDQVTHCPDCGGFPLRSFSNGS